MPAKLLSIGTFLSVCLIFGTISISAQVRPRIVSTNSTTQNPPTTRPNSAPARENEPAIVASPQRNASRSLAAVPASPQVYSRPILTDNIRVQTVQPKTTTNNYPVPNNSADEVNVVRLSNFQQKLFQAMQAKIGINYVYGTEGPGSYDCSGLVWKVYQEAGYDFGRASAASYWNQFQPANDNQKYQFGTLVFFNGLGHIGIVVDENGFYHASSSKGVTYSSFKGYWEKRIVGFRRVPVN